MDQTLLEYARYPANIVRLKARGVAGYQKRFPAMLDKKIFLSIDEYAYFGGGFGRGVDLKLALAYGMIFNEMLRYTDFLTMSAHTMGVSTLDYHPQPRRSTLLASSSRCTASTSCPAPSRWRSQATHLSRHPSIPSVAISQRRTRAARLIRSTCSLRSLQTTST